MAKVDPRDPMVSAIEAIGSRMLRSLGEDHNYGRQMKGEINRLRLSAEALDRVRASRSPLDTPAAHALKVSKRARTFNNEVTASINRLGRLWSEGYEDAQRRIAEKVNLRPDAFASEIRQAFRAMDSKAQAKLINELVESNRGPELAAIVKAPSVLTGISDAQRAAYEKMILTRHAGDEVDEIERLEEVFQSALSATGAAAKFATELTNPGNLAQIEQAAADADAAMASFDQSLQQ